MVLQVEGEDCLYHFSDLRACQEINVSSSGQEAVVPVAMKRVSPELEFGHLLVGNLQPGRISIGVELAFHSQASGGGSGCNKVDDDLMTDERFAPPVLADEREQPMFDLVPLARARREVTDRYLQPDFVGQFLQLPLPPPHPCAVAAARIGCNQQAFGLRIAATPHPAPPAANALDRKGRCVVVHSHAHPSDVSSQVVDPVRSYLSFIRLADGEVV